MRDTEPPETEEPLPACTFTEPPTVAPLPLIKVRAPPSELVELPLIIAVEAPAMADSPAAMTILPADDCALLPVSRVTEPVTCSLLAVAILIEPD